MSIELCTNIYLFHRYTLIRYFFFPVNLLFSLTVCVSSLMFGENIQDLDNTEIFIFVMAIIPPLVLSFLYQEPKTKTLQKSMDSLPYVQPGRVNSLTEVELSLIRTER